MVTILAANDTVDIRHLFASNQRAEKMKKSLNMINTVLKPINRAFLGPNPMTSEELSILENRRRRLDERLDKTVESELDKGRLLDTEIANRINQLRESKKQTSLLFEAELVTGNFMRQVYRAARSIHSELAKAGRRGIDVDILRDNLAFEYPVLIEALKKLEKLKRIEWLDDTTVVIPDSLKQVPGKIYVIYVEKIVQGKALVIVDDKWHARLNHYDYEGPRELLKSGSELRVIGELYHDDGVLNIRVKQIV
jgi:Fanconi anemia group M protein